MKKHFSILITSALLFSIGTGLVTSDKGFNKIAYAIENEEAEKKVQPNLSLIQPKGILFSEGSNETENNEDLNFSELYLETLTSYNESLTLKSTPKIDLPTFSVGPDVGVVEFLLSDLKAEEEKRNQEILENEKRLAEEAAAKQKAEEEAIIKAKLEAEAKAKAEKEAKEKAEKEARARAEAKAAQQVSEAKQTQTTSNESAGEWMTFEATAYTPYCTGCSGITANGHDLRKSIYKNGKRVVAVDRKLIPMGTTLEVKLKNGTTFLATAQDTGGAIKNRKIDIAHETKQSAYSFGRQKVQVRIIK